MTDLASRPRRSAGPSPLRAPGSVRRTSTIDVSWPEGRAGSMRVVGRARDLVTPRSGAPPRTIAQDSFEAFLKPDRTIEAITAEPARAALAGLVGARAGGGLRRALNEVVPGERRDATPLYLILDDISGASLVSSVAWSQWDPDWLLKVRAGLTGPDLARLLQSREDVCIGHAPGSSAQDPDLATREYGEAPAAEFRRPDDPDGWHAMDAQPGVGMRRARRIDVSLADVIVIDAEFQDSATRPDGGRAAVHEYGLSVTADPLSLRLLSVVAEPRVLPYPECPAATGNVSRLLGTPLPELRDKVLVELARAAGCTHLNDALRALAEAPALLQHLG